MTAINHHPQSSCHGTGLCYSLALFISYEANMKYVLAEVELMAAEGALRFEGSAKESQETIRKTIERLAATRWFSLAVGPLMAVRSTNQVPPAIHERIDHLKNQCAQWAHPNSPARAPLLLNVSWAVEEAKEIVRLIDEHHGIPTVRESLNARLRKEPVLVFKT
jgi:hypothetical protein